MSVADASAAILEVVTPMEARDTAIAEALGLVLAEDVASPVTLPPWDNASMDGYAVRAADVRDATSTAPRMLRVVGTIAAGSSSERPVGVGEAMRIMTGAPLPAGADSVVRVEDTDAGEHHVQIRSGRDALRNVRPRGEDITRGDVAVAAGTELHASHIGFLASVGRSRVKVYARPRVAILTSGDELVDLDHFDEVLSGAKIVTSNSYVLAAAVREAGGEPIHLGTVGDDPVALRERLRDVHCDLLITSGGVSVGAFDYTRTVLEELGAGMCFWRVRIRPGAPLGFGTLRDIPWLGLPGNPVSSAVTFELFARPAIRKMLGHTRLFRRVVRVRMEEALTITAALTHFLRAHAWWDGTTLVARLTGPQGSGLLSSMARANALIVVPPERPRIAAGEEADALLLRNETHHSDVLSIS